MASPTRISRDLVVDALRCNCGNVSAAAEDLGISRRGLYDRCQAFSIDPSDYRAMGVTFSSSGVTTAADFTVRSEDATVQAVPTSRVGKWRDSEVGARLGSIMRQVGEVVGTAVVGAAEDFERQIARKAASPPRLHKPYLDLLHSVRRQFNAAEDADHTATDVLEDYISWGMERYAAERLGKRRKLVSLEGVVSPKAEGNGK